MEDDKINNYVDRTGVSSDTAFMLENLNSIFEAFKKLDGIKIGLGKVTGLSETIPLIKEANQQINVINESQIKLADSTRKAADANKAEAQSLGTVAEALAKNKTEQDKLKQAKKDLNDEFKKGNIDQDTFNKRLGAILQSQNALSVSAKDLTRALSNINKESQAAEGSLNELRAQLNLALQAFDSLSAVDKNSDVGKGLEERIKSLTESISKEEQATGRFQRNVGNYANSLAGSFEKVSQEISKLKIKQNELIQQQQRNPIGFKTGGGDDELNKVTAALNQLNTVSQIGFKVNQNATQQVRQLENAYVSLASGGIQAKGFLEEFKNEIGKVKDEVGDLKESIKLAASDTRSLDVLIGGAQAIAGGFGIAQGAAALFGDENEDLQKTLVKLNGVMTILNGLQAIQNELKKKDNILTIIQTNLQKAYTTVIGTSTGALKTFRTALAATGIGVFLVAIGALILAFDKVKAAMSGISKEQQNIIDQAEQRAEQEDYNKELLDAQEESLKLMGLSEEQITKEKIKQLEKNKQAKLDLLEARRLTLESQRDAANRSFSIIKTIVDIITIPITAISKVISAITGKKLPTIGDLVGKELFDPNKVDKDFEELSKKIKLETTQIQGEIDGLINGQNDKRKQNAEKSRKALEDELKKQQELEERNRKARFEMEKLDIESRARLAEKKINNEDEDFDSKLAALDAYIKAKKELVEAEFKFESETKGHTDDEIKLLEKQKQDKLNQLTEEGEEKRTGIITQNNDKVKELLEKTSASAEAHRSSIHETEMQNIQNQFDAELIQLDKRFAAGLIKEDEYNSKKLDLQLESQRALLAEDIKFTRETLDLAEARAKASGKQEDIDAVASAKSSLAALELDLIQLITDAEIDANKRKEQSDQQAFDKKVAQLEQIAAIAQQVFSIASGFAGAADKEKNAIQEQIDALEKKKQKDIEVANAAIQNVEARAAAIKVIEARADAQREQLEIRKRQAQERQARFEKAASIASIIMNTAVAVVKALPNIALAIATGILGAAQLAVAIKTPIPKFFKGKNLDKMKRSAMDNYQGPGIVDDGKTKEAIIRENGNVEIAKGPLKPRLTFLNRNDIVLPNVGMMTDRVIAKTQQQIMSVNINGELEVRQQQSNAELKNEIRSMKNDVVKAITSKKELHLNASEGGMSAMWKHLAGSTKYISDQTNW